MRVYVHPRCSESYRVYQLVSELGLPGVNFTNTELDPLGALSRGVLAVPAFEREEEEKVILQGWVTREDVVSLLKEGRVGVASKEEAFERLLRSVFSTFTVAVAAYLTGDLSIVAGSPVYVMSASGAYFLGEGSEEFLDYATWKLREVDFGSVEERLLSNIASNFARDVLWLEGVTPTRELIESMGFRFFRAWITARASVGRIFVPHSYAWGGLQERIQRAWSYVLERIDELGPRVKEEQGKIPENWI